jgi:glycosyltransferase involved in cell wall biosynthesis
MKAFCPDIHLIPNGYDPELFTPEKSHHPTLITLQKWPGPVIGFAGNLEAKIDIALIKEIACHFAHAKIVLLGSTHMNPAVRQLCSESNVIMPGVIPHDQLKPWLECFDVGIIPHLTTSQTHNMNPLKAYLYLAHGIPVVATEVPNLPVNTVRVRSCPDHASFISAIEQFLREQPCRTTPDGFIPELTMTKKLAGVFDLILPFDVTGP